MVSGFAELVLLFVACVSRLLFLFPVQRWSFLQIGFSVVLSCSLGDSSAREELCAADCVSTCLQDLPFVLLLVFWFAPECIRVLARLGAAHAGRCFRSFKLPVSFTYSLPI